VESHQKEVNKMNNDIENVPSNSTASNGTGEKLIPFCRQVLTQQLGDAK
jgi:hypothetical protein